MNMAELDVSLVASVMATTHPRSALAVLPVELWLEIIGRFCPLDRESFALTGRAASHLVRVAMDTWDATKGDFCGADQMAPLAPDALVRLPRRRAVTCIRHPRIERCDYIGYEMYVLKKTVAALANMGSCLQHVEIHRGRLLTVPLLGVVLPEMPRLRLLGIYSCQLIDISQIPQILSHLDIRPRSHPVRLDFLPSTAVNFCCHGMQHIAVPALLFSMLPDDRVRDAQLLHPDGAFIRYCHEYVPAHLLPHAERGRLGHYQVVRWMINLRNPTKYQPVQPGSKDARLWACSGRLHADATVPGCFFPKGRLNGGARDDRPGEYVECWACRLVEELESYALKESGLGPANAVVNGWLQPVAANLASIANTAASTTPGVDNETVPAPEGVTGTAAATTTTATTAPPTTSPTTTTTTTTSPTTTTAPTTGEVSWSDTVIASARAAAAEPAPPVAHDQTWGDAANARAEQRRLQQLIAEGRLPPGATTIPPRMKRWVPRSSLRRQW